MSIKGGAKKRRKDSNKVQHVEDPDQTLVFILLLDEGELVQPYPPSAHEAQEGISLNNGGYIDEEDSHEALHIEDPVEATTTSIPPTNEGKQMVNFSHMDGLMMELSDVFDNHIDAFKHIWRRKWDMVCFIIDGDPIYDIECSSQAKGVELSSSIGLHAYMIQVFGNLIMIWSQICSIHSRMICCNMLMVNFSHPFGVVMHILLGMQICSIRIFNHLSPQI
jgi:hypothetical protein